MSGRAHRSWPACPGWREFADGALRDLCLTPAHLATRRSNNSKIFLDPGLKLSIARAIERQTGATINFKGLLHRTPLEKHPDGNRLYSAILALSNVVVTTELRLLARSNRTRPGPAEPQVAAATTPVDVRRNAIWRPEDFLPGLLASDNTVIHLHGSVEDPRSMVMTTQDYLQHYRNDRAPFGRRTVS